MSLANKISIRPATTDDALALAKLHALTFNETHGPGPTVEVRESQWRQKLVDVRNFCFLAIDATQNLIGFASGHPYDLDDLPYDGRFEKIYVLKSWHRQGIGRQLFNHVVAEFQNRDIDSMLLFSEANNSSIGFFERMGGQRMLTSKGEFHGGYGWLDLALRSH